MLLSTPRKRGLPVRLITPADFSPAVCRLQLPAVPRPGGGGGGGHRCGGTGRAAVTADVTRLPERCDPTGGGRDGPYIPSEAYQLDDAVATCSNDCTNYLQGMFFHYLLTFV